MFWITSCLHFYNKLRKNDRENAFFDCVKTKDDTHNKNCKNCWKKVETKLERSSSLSCGSSLTSTGAWLFSSFLILSSVLGVYRHRAPFSLECFSSISFSFSFSIWFWSIRACWTSILSFSNSCSASFREASAILASFSNFCVSCSYLCHRISSCLPIWPVEMQQIGDCWLLLSSSPCPNVSKPSWYHSKHFTHWNSHLHHLRKIIVRNFDFPFGDLVCFFMIELWSVSERVPKSIQKLWKATEIWSKGIKKSWRLGCPWKWSIRDH